jgi:hypothetical protein
MPHAHVITSSWPVVVIVGPAHWEAGWVQDLDKQMGALFARRERFAIITDTRPITSVPGAAERKPLTEWLRRPEHLRNQARWNVGSATLMTSAVMRGALQAIYWVWTPASPQMAAKDLDEAWNWCVELLQKEQIAFPQPPSDLRELALREMVTPQRTARASP